MNRLLIIAGASLALCACSHAGGVRLDAGKGLAVAAAGFDGATLSAETAVDAGRLKGSTAQHVHDALAKVKTAKDAGLTAYQAGDTKTATAQAQTALDNLADAKSAIPQR